MKGIAMLRRGVSYLPLVLLAGTVHAQSFDLSGHAEIETRIFPFNPAFSEQRRSTVSPSVALEPEFRYQWNEGQDRLTAIPFLRIDSDDDERTHGDLREFSWTHRTADWDLVAGVSKVFWGVAESRHLVDVINQADLVEDLDEEDRLGQPMVNLNYFTRFGTFGLFVLPGFRERTFPDRKARLRGLYPVLVDDPHYESGAKQYHVDFAGRWSDTIGGLDIGIAHFHGTGREPRLVPEVRSGETVFVPFYDQIDQSSVDAQYTVGDWLLKFEGLTRSGQGDRFFASVSGFEYTLHSIFGMRPDLGLLAEYHYDGRDDTAPPTSFDHDIFFGTRLTLNDPQSTSVLAGAIVDQSNQETAINVEGERRIGDRWKLEMEARFFTNVSPTDIVLYGIRRDSHILLRLSRYF